MLAELSTAALGDGGAARLQFRALADVTTSAAPLLPMMSAAQLDTFLQGVVQLGSHAGCQQNSDSDSIEAGGSHQLAAHYVQLLESLAVQLARKMPDNVTQHVSMEQSSTANTISTHHTNTSSSNSTISRLSAHDHELLQQLRRLHLEQLPAAVPAAIEHISTADDKLTLMQAAVAVRSILYSATELRIPLPADAMRGMCQLTLKLGPALKPDERSFMLSFIAEQQMGNGKRLANILASTSRRTSSVPAATAAGETTSAAGKQAGSPVKVPAAAPAKPSTAYCCKVFDANKSLNAQATIAEGLLKAIDSSHKSKSTDSSVKPDSLCDSA